MTSLARYHGRSPRYILDTDDDCLVRVAGPKQTPWEEGTEIKNVSLTGLAFTAPNDLSPLLGEVIKIQFIPPGAKQMACYGIVTRLDDLSDTQTLVGVHFYKMDISQRVVLAQGLARRFKERQERGLIDEALDKATLHRSFWKRLPVTFLMWVFGLIWGASILFSMHIGTSGLTSLLKKLF